VVFFCDRTLGSLGYSAMFPENCKLNYLIMNMAGFVILVRISFKNLWLTAAWD